MAENVVLGAKGLTQSKKLLGMGLLNSDTNSKNVWVSSKLNALTSNSANSALGHINDVFSHNNVPTGQLSLQNHFSPAISNFNFFETSRM